MLTKAKFVLLGLTKLNTLLSMMAFFAVYWTMFGWKFALGFVLAIYIHEMGHVVALRKYGIAASAPMFVPFLGAFVRMRQYPANVGQDARVGLAGPIWGLGASVVAWLGALITGQPIWYAIAHTSAWRQSCRVTLRKALRRWGGACHKGYSQSVRLDTASRWRHRSGALSL